MAGLQTQLLFEITLILDLEMERRVGATPRGYRQIDYVKGGAFDGPKLKGEVLPGGTDWLLTRADGVREPDVRLTLRTVEGDLIGMSYRGIANVPPQVRQRILAGESVDPSEYYIRTTPVFETASEKHEWLNRLVTVAVGTRTPTGVVYLVYAIQ